MEVALQPLLVGGLWMVLVIALPSLLLWAGLQIPRLVDALRERGARRRGEDRPPRVPLEKLVADLRRLRTDLVHDRPTTNVRLTALLLAYDDVLESTCERLELPTRLHELPIGLDRDLERLRTEAAVQEAGISLESPGRRHGRPAPG